MLLTNSRSIANWLYETKKNPSTAAKKLIKPPN